MHRHDVAGDAPVRSAMSRDRFYFMASAYALFALLASTNLPTPLYREYARAFAFSPLTMTLVFAVYVCAMVPSLLVFGPLSDAIGKRKVLVGSVLAAIVALLLFALARSTPWLYAARLLQGLALGAASGTLTAALADLQPQGQRHRAALAATVASLGGLASGPLIAGLLAQYGPARFVTPYLAGMVLLLPVLFWMMRFPDSGARAAWRLRRPSIPRPMLRTFAQSGAASFLAFSVLGLFLALVPTIVVELTRTTNLLIAGGAVTLMLLSSMGAQLLGTGRSTRHLQMGGLLVLASGLALLLWAAQQASLPMLLLASAGAGVGHGLAFLGGITDINQHAPPAQRGEVISTYYVVVYLGLCIPVVAIGFLALDYGLLRSVQLFACVVIPLCAAMALALAVRRE